MRPIILLAITITFCAAADNDLPAKVDRALAEHRAAIEKADAVHQESVSEATDDLLKALEKEKVAATKKGNLEVANAVAALIEVHSAKTDFLGNSLEKESDTFDPQKEWIGGWNISVAGFQTTWVVNANGTISSGTGNRGKWRLDADRIIINWESGHIHFVDWPISLGTLNGKEGAKSITGSKIIP